MSRETEKIMTQLARYMDEHQDELLDGASAQDVAQRFMDEYNASLRQKNILSLPQTADDYLELAEDATTEKKKLEYLRKALELDPNNLDTARMVAEMEAEKPEELLASLSALIEKGTTLMEAGGYFRDCIGEFWSVLETRPFMRLHHAYFELLIQCGMMRQAMNEGEEMLRLCGNDNLGVRFELMHLYAFLENEDGALALHKKYDEYDATQMLLPLAVLYYKKADYERSLQYLRRLAKANRDTKKFLRMVATDHVIEIPDEICPHGYQPFTIEEFISECFLNDYLFDSAGCFFDWAYRSLKKSSRQKED